MSLQDSKKVENIKVLLKVGADGRGIVSVEKTDTQGDVDTYTITLSDETKFNFYVTNGSSIDTIEKTGTSGAVDTYTITLTNGETSTFTVTNGVGTIASDIGYDNTTSGLSANKVQGAIDELNSEKYPKTGGTISGNVNLEGNGGATLNVGTNGVGIINIGGGNTFKASISTGQDEFTELTANRTYTLPDKNGTVALREDFRSNKVTLTYDGLGGLTSGEMMCLWNDDSYTPNIFVQPLGVVSGKNYHVYPQIGSLVVGGFTFSIKATPVGGDFSSGNSLEVAYSII